ncbi:hypothetical protein SBDP2_1710002 [Syntrophobacter sp. SbD2]|nr:hypothetical protein SBDP2_1710002 [Syntrophobacter sp. SbD2]
MRQAMRIAMTASRNVEFSLEAHPTLWGGGTRPSTAGKEVCPKIAKTGLIDISLHV